mgnify:CR=1 FL=1|tara:strand:+ start:174997 stop:175530 length:534 start_codon:yes stop_codon:yes gene_type:complete
MSKSLKTNHSKNRTIDTFNIKAVKGLINVEDSKREHTPESIHKLMVGVSGNDAFNKLINQVTSSVSGNDNDDKLNSILPMLLDIAPRDALEGMLAVQMIATHNMSMEMAMRVMLPDQTSEGVDMNVNRANKLMRTFTTQIETLQKYRNKGQQTIQVQHVTVNDGGQAIVGNLNGGEG